MSTHHHPNEQRVHDAVTRHRAASIDHPDAVVEDDLLTGRFRWANQKFLEKTGYTAEQLTTLSAFDLMPEEHHAFLRERFGGKRGKYFIAPIRTSTNQMSWWFSSDLDEVYPVHWTRSRYLTTTDVAGPHMEIMTLLTEVTNVSGELFFEHESVHDWVRGEIARLDGNDSELRRELAALNTAVSALRSQVAQSASAARDAANASLRAAQDVNSLKRQHENLETRISTEILRLIGTDQMYERQLTDFKTQLSTAADRAKDSIQAAAKDAGKTISFKISFPVGVVGGLAVIVNYILGHPEILAKLFRLE